MAQRADAVVKGLYDYRLLSTYNLLNGKLARAPFTLSLRHLLLLFDGLQAKTAPGRSGNVDRIRVRSACFMIFSKPAVEPTPGSSFMSVVIKVHSVLLHATEFWAPERERGLPKVCIRSPSQHLLSIT